MLDKKCLKENLSVILRGESGLRAAGRGPVVSQRGLQPWGSRHALSRAQALGLAWYRLTLRIRGPALGMSVAWGACSCPDQTT